VVPEVVVYEANSKDSPAVDYAGLVPLLIEAIKEQQKVLEEKDTALADLEARVQALEEATITEAREDQRYRLGFNVFAIWSWLAAQCC
jgi:hypothetical protein